jgi:hypothetical protein
MALARAWRAAALLVAAALLAGATRLCHAAGQRAPW